jgi:hypothetical protein
MKRTVVSSLVLSIVALLAFDRPAAEAGPCGGQPTNITCACGDTVVSDYTLPGHLTCTGNGLIVASGVSLSLSNKKLTGTSKLGVGILLEGSGGIVGGGVVQNFNVGIQSSGAAPDWTIGEPLGITITNNRTGLDLITWGTSITDAAVTSNLGDGLVLRGGANSIVGITCSKNGGRGMAITGSLNFVDTNRCELNGGHGIDADGDDNVFVRNLSSRNTGSGLRAVGDGNSFDRNQAKTNGGDGVRGIGADLNTDRRNYGTANGGVNCLIDGFTPTGGGRYC